MVSCKMLETRNSFQTDEFFTRGKHEDLDVYYISQSYFALPRQSIRNTSDRLVLFKQTLRDVQSIYYDIGSYDMKNDEFKKKCVIKLGKENSFNFVLIRLKIKTKVNIVFSTKVKPHILNAFLKLNLFKKPM